MNATEVRTGLTLVTHMMADMLRTRQHGYGQR
jgi:hypothetical protein